MRQQNKYQNYQPPEKKWKYIAIAAVCVTIIFVTVVLLVVVNNLKDKNLAEEAVSGLSDGLDTLESKANEFVQEDIIGSEGSVEAVTRVKLADLVGINDLSTLQYNYNAVCHVYNSETNEPVYHIAYEGMVNFGINMKDIEEEIDETNMTVTIYLPDVQIQGQPTVVAGSMRYIFEQQGYDESSAFVTSQQLCEEDLTAKIDGDEAIWEAARTNTLYEVEALTKPLVDTFYPEYTLVIEWK